MSAALTAQDLWPLLLKLPHEEESASGQKGVKE
jgi:hypothetical protein